MASSPTDAPWPLPELIRARRAIVVVDVVESVRLMQEDEAGFIDRWRRFVHAVRTDVLPQHGGRMVKSLGDGMLLEFGTVPSAAAAALRMQVLASTIDAAGTQALLPLRMGLHPSDITIDADDIYGAGVNLTARLATLARPGEIVLSAQAREELIHGFDADLEDMGECWLKHMDQPVRAWRATPPTAAQPLMRADDLVHHQASIAVLPFVLHGPADDQGRLLGELLAEDVASWLARVPHLTIVSCLSTQSLRQRRAAYPAMAQLLGVKYLAHGRCVRDGSRLRIEVQLIEGDSGRMVWNGTERMAADELSHGHAPVAQALASGLSKALLGTEAARVSITSLPNLESYSILYGAITLLHRLSRRDFERARELLEHLVERHPRSPVPRAWLGKWYVMRIGQGWSSEPTRDGQHALATTAAAVDLDPIHPFALTMDGFATGYVKKDFAVAEQRYDDALRINPSESLAWLFRSAMLGYRDDGPAAIDAALRAQGLSPIDPMQYYFDHFTALALLLAGRYQDSIHYGLRSLRGNRTHASTLRALAIAQALAGHVDAARATGAALLQQEPTLTLRAFKSRYPGRSSSQIERLADGLAMAGVPA
jgi:adenylate cyclase